VASMAKTDVGSITNSRVSGNADMNTKVTGGVVNAAIGLGTRAKTKIGSITNTSAGSVNMGTTLTGGSVNAAIGFGSSSSVSHGSVD